MISKERINRPKLCFRVIRPRIIFSSHTGPILLWSSVLTSLHFHFDPFFLWVSFHFTFLFHFSLVPFSTFCFAFVYLYIFQHLLGLHFPHICLPASDIWSFMILRENFSLSLPPSMEGDPWSGFRKKFIKFKRGDY